MPCCDINWRNFGLDHNNPKKFYASRSEIPLAAYVTYRVLITGYTSSFAIYYVFFSYHDRTPWIFLTVWSYLFQTVTLITELLITLLKTYYNPRNPDHDATSLDWYLKLKWVCHNISSSVPYVVTIGYWTLLWSKDSEKYNTTYLISDIQVHGINSLVALLDQVLDPNPMRPHHFIHPLAFMIIYGVFSAIHFATGGSPIYPFLDWQKAGPTLLTCLLVYILTTAMHLIVCLIKLLMSKLCPNSDYDVISGSDGPLLASNRHATDDYSDSSI